MIKIIPVTSLRRNFGSIVEELPKLEMMILTKGGKPYIEMRTSSELKREQLLKTAGMLKNTETDNNDFWKEALKKKSRKTPISL